MIDFIIDIQRKIIHILRKFDNYLYEHLYKYFKGPVYFVKVEEDGFRLGVKGHFFGKIIYSRRFKKYYWKDIKEINTWDNDMVSGIELVPYDGKHKLVFDYFDNWDQFVDELPKRFIGFNLHNYNVGRHLAWGILPCWRSDQVVGNLVNRDDGVIVWEKDGSVFSKLEG